MPRGVWLSPGNERNPRGNLGTPQESYSSRNRKGGGRSQVGIAPMCRAVGVLQRAWTKGSDDVSRSENLEFKLEERSPEYRSGYGINPVKEESVVHGNQHGSWNGDCVVD